MKSNETIGRPPLMRAKRMILIAAVLAPLALLGIIAGLLLTPGTRAKADAVATPARPAVHRPAPPAANAQPTAYVEPGMVLKRVLDTGGPIRFGDWFWDEKGVPAGPVVITIDLQAQVLSIFRDGYEIGTAAIIYGADGMPTPLGTFPILQKDADHVSNIYVGAPMPYMLRLTWDGVSIHGAPIDPTYATHGCIGVPTPFAKKLFGATKLGDKVIVTNGKMMVGSADVPTDAATM
jgi:lipoprotein-anchoring transpeptidase ErfK/SrfK